MRIKRVLSVICVIAMMVSVIYLAGSVFQRNHSGTFKYAEFWEDPAEYDVWFIGSSHTYHDIQPMELWRSQGITSYDLAFPTGHIAQTYWTLMCALEKAKPDLVVLDTYELHLDKKLVNVSEKVHTNFDEIPFSRTKVRALMDLTDGDTGAVMEYMFPLSLRHNEWRERDIKDILVPLNVGPKGSNIKSNVEDMSKARILDRNDSLKEDNISMQYLRMIIEECESRDIDILILCLPYYGHAKNQRGLNSTERVIAEYGVPFVDVRWDGLVDPACDMADLNHANFSGAVKVTDFISAYLADNYSLKDHREDGSRISEEWKTDYSEYCDYLLRRIKNNSDLAECLVLLSAGQYSAQICSKEPLGKTEQRLIDNHDNILVIDQERAESVLDRKMQKDIALIVTDRDTGDVILIRDFLNE